MFCVGFDKPSRDFSDYRCIQAVHRLLITSHVQQTRSQILQTITMTGQCLLQCYETVSDDEDEKDEGDNVIVGETSSSENEKSRVKVMVQVILKVIMNWHHHRQRRESALEVEKVRQVLC